MLLFNTFNYFVQKFICTLPWPWLVRLAFEPDGVSKSMADSRPKSPQLRLGHLRLGDLQHWHLCTPCIALDLAVQLKLWAGICAWTQIWVQDQLGSSGPHCTRWVDDQHRQAGFEPQFVTDLPLPIIPTFSRLSGHWPCVKSCLVGGSDIYNFICT